MRRTLLPVLGACLLAVGAAGGWYLFAEPASSARETVGSRARTVPVETALAESGRAVTLVRATGTLIASDAVVVQPEIAGRVTAVLFEQGQAVRADDPLIRLDPRTLEAELAKAEAALTLARENYGRSESLSRRGATAAQTLDEARAALRTARPRWRWPGSASTTPTSGAPFDGVVGLKQLSVGRYVEPGDELVALERIDPLYLDFRLSERWLTKLVPGDTVTSPSTPCPVAVSPARSLPSTLRSTSTAARCSCVPPCPTRTAACGPACSRGRVELDERPDAVLVPEAAVVLQEAGPIVYRIAEGRAAHARDHRRAPRRPESRSRRASPQATRSSSTAMSGCATRRRSRSSRRRPEAEPVSLPEICIRRPVFATVLSLLLMLVGVVSYARLPVREYPGHRPAGGFGGHRLSGRQPGDHGDPGHSGARGVDRRHRRHRRPVLGQPRRKAAGSPPGSPSRPTPRTRRRMCATGFRACAAGCRTRSTSR